MTWMMGETVAASAMSYIADAQAAKLAEVALAHEGGDYPMAMRPFVAVRFAEPLVRPDADFPLLFCTLEGVDDEPGVGGLRRGAWGLYRFEWTVVAYKTEANEETAAASVRRLAMRYLGAVLEMLIESYDASARPYEWGVGDVTRREFGMTYTRGGGEYMADARLLITARAKEAAL